MFQPKYASARTKKFHTKGCSLFLPPKTGTYIDIDIVFGIDITGMLAVMNDSAIAVCSDIDIDTETDIDAKHQPRYGDRHRYRYQGDAKKNMLPQKSV